MQCSGANRHLKGSVSKHWTDVNGQRLFYRCIVDRSRCDRLPVVCVHGLGVSSRYFQPLMRHLAEAYDVYSPDLPGHGHSPASSRPQSIEALAQSLLDWLKAMQLDRVVLVGQSLGCQVAVEAALRQPARVERLVLIAPTLDPATRSLRIQLPRFIADIPFERLALIPVVAWDYLRMGWRAVPELQAMFAYSIEDRLPSLSQPLLLVRGEFDPVASRRWLDEAARRHGSARVEEIAGWGHAVQFSAPGRVAEVVRQFLAL
ncbi:alpha/beta hydrolase [Halomonas sp. McH1-25]|uniref:alpha/beta fold hydrolase n=1 Tax=unclassified Halomonas TaxID=2609666 RepID=UPI001EF58286|nr:MULTISPECIES: alpha/beta hydrolase [unclassified Halomonas]MCG7598774.1 alpha/beta hydrolase [Halomonas sp. McH1-25]MCP1340737.1 alpha/beta hydrolase [Halomonas sp. FL8]MCP1359508.1 alpha/beta hydrolase [Halomonas sp. BBD45]MCP1367674.1 alpha/beta hydrolase [Halomonas sp. BBD48]